MAPSFSQQQAGDPLYILQDSFSASMPAYTVAFWPGAGQTGLPSSLTLAETWQLGTGAYLFLGAAPTSQPAFVAALTTYLQDPAYPAPRFLWIANPNDPSGQWQSSRIVLAGGLTTSFSEFSFGSVALYIGMGCSVAINGTQDGLELTVPSGAAYLTAMNGSAVLPGVASPIVISFLGASAGCLTFSLTLDNSGASSLPDLDRLDVGHRYFADDGAWPGSGRVASWRYPIFDPASAPSLPLVATLDPLNPLLPNRTYFSFLNGGAPSGPTLSSFYVTAMGYRLSLTPTLPDDNNLDNVPRLVFQRRALTSPSQPSDPTYLTPAGLFTIGVLTNIQMQVGTGNVQQMLCGAAGLEYLGLTTVTGNVLYFFPGQPAYSPSYPAGGAGAPGLSGVATTAWAYPIGPAAAGLAYYAQPNTSTLFKATDSTDFLSYLEISAGVLPGQVSTTGTPPTMFPMVAFPGIQDTNYADYQQFEQQVLSPVRRQIIYQLATAAPPIAPISGGTPQGILFEFNPALTVTLAQTGGGTQKLQFTNVTGELLSAFQSNQLFLVISSKADLLEYAGLAGSILSIATDTDDVWNFDVFDGWETHGNILIFKFGDKSLADLAADTTTWVGGATFNQTVADTQKEILAIIADAQTRAKTEPEFEYFVNTVVSQPGWNGILMLNVDVPLNGLPDQIAGIAAGIDAANFYAHHLGVTLTPLTVANSVVQLGGDSSLFGLIYYNDPADLVNNGNPYQFKVLSLKVLFFNSAVTSFSSQIEMMVSQMFGEPVTSPDQKHGENNIVLNGTYQQQGGQSSYLFLSSEDTIFTAASHVLDNVEIVKAQFVTVVAPDQVKAGGEAESSLLLWGTLRFKELKDFDLFSFGNADGFSGGITYAGLAVNLSYPPATPEQKTFAFDASQITFDLATSAARPTSLYARFPLSLTGLTQVTAASTTPTSFGYLGVDAPLGQSSLTPPWFGLVMSLNLGSAGALAAKAGFTATLLGAWSPNENSASISIGLKLPGTGGSKSTFSLESVLKLKIRRIQFVVVKGAYILNLNNIALSVLTLTLPPGGQTNFLLFGDPNGQDNTTLGWYAGYAKTPKKKSDKPPALTSGRRALPPGGSE
jgi:hypothetical protein